MRVMVILNEMKVTASVYRSELGADVDTHWHSHVRCLAHCH